MLVTNPFVGREKNPSRAVVCFELWSSSVRNTAMQNIRSFAAAALPFGKSKTRRREEAVEQARQFATLLDDAFRIPGTNIRFGWDTVIGLVPGVGDAATTIVGLVPLLTAWKLGASRWLLFRMLANVGVDATFGAIPVVGDVFDLFYRANRRNARLLERHLATTRGPAETPSPIGRARS